MKGTVEIFQGYVENGIPKVHAKPIFKETNMVVDGAKEHIADMLTRYPTPSGVASATSATYDVSNFGVRGLSVAPNESAFLRNNSLAAVSGYAAASAMWTPTITYRSLDPSSGDAWSYLPHISNYDFTEVNTMASGSTFPNSHLQNPKFLEHDEFLTNSKFREYYLDTDLSSASMNGYMSLYELPGWKVRSCLRYSNDETAYNDQVQCASIARHPIQNVSSLSGMIVEGYADTDDGVLEVRSWGDATPDPGDDASGMAELSQVFQVSPPNLDKRIDQDPTLGVLGELAFKFKAVSSTDDAKIQVFLKNTDKASSYNFSANSNGDRNTWGGEGYPLGVRATIGSHPWTPASGTVSYFFNMPNTWVGDNIIITIKFVGYSGSHLFQTYFWDAGVRVLKGWAYGNIAKGGTIKRVRDNNYTASATALTIEANDAWTELHTADVSNVNYISQLTKFSPRKKYCPLIYASTDNVAQSPRVALLKKSSSDYTDPAAFNKLTDITASSFSEYRNNTNVVPSPYLAGTDKVSYKRYVDTDVKPSDLCLEIESGTSISGMTTLDYSGAATLRCSVLKNLTGYEDGRCSTSLVELAPPTGNCYFVLRTSKLDANGSHRYFNWHTRVWQSGGECFNEQCYLNTSSYSTQEEYALIRSSEIPVGPLQGVVDNLTSVDLILSAVNISSFSTFIKNVSLTTQAPSYAEDAQESYVWNSVLPASKWNLRTAAQSGQYSFSGIDYTDVDLGSGMVTQLDFGISRINKMYGASASVHDPEATYQFITAWNGLGTLTTSALGITDEALVVTDKTVSGDVITSESYLPNTRHLVSKSPYIQIHAWPSTTDNQAPNQFFQFQPLEFGASTKNTPSALDGFSSTNGLVIGTPLPTQYSDSTDRALYDLVYEFPVSDITFPTTEGYVAFSLDYHKFSDSGSSPLAMDSYSYLAVAETPTGTYYWSHSLQEWSTVVDMWDLKNDYSNLYESWTSWSQGLRNDVYSDPTNTKVNTVFSNKISLGSNILTPDSVIRLIHRNDFRWDSDITLFPSLSRQYVLFENWKLYRVVEGPQKDLPAFPTPIDTTVQPASEEEMGALGHYRNQIHFLDGSFSSTETTPYKRALSNGGWAPTSGIDISGVETSGCANGFGVVNSDGYVYPNIGGQPSHAGGTVYTKGFSTTTKDLGGGASALEFIYDISSSDMDFFEYQGGIGSIGLWLMNADETYRKLDSYGFEVSSVYDTSAYPWSTSLYNVTDIRKNPVFNLLSKKAFRTPLSYTSGINNFLRIMWSVQLV